MKKILILTIVLFYTAHLHADIKVLSIDGFDWHEPTAWAPLGVPTAQDTVEIYGYTFIKIDSVARAKHVFIGPNGELDIKRNQSLNLRGTLVVENSDDIGIINEGIINNGGRITIKNTDSYGIINIGSLRVKEGAKLNIVKASVIGLENLNELHNHGLIEINLNSIAYGIYSRANLSNFNTGQIVINSSPNFGFGIVISSLDTLLNEGVIEIHNNYTGITNRGTTINRNLICIDSLYSKSAITNSGFFVNDENGIINISNMFEDADYGITNYGLDTFLNYGIITIKKSQGKEGISNNGNFMNYDTIHIQRINDNGIQNTGMFDNFGYLNISETNDDAIENQDTLYNRSGGTIRILNLDSMNANGIYNNSGFIMNDGTIDIDNISQGYGIYNKGEFLNLETTFINQTASLGFWNEGTCIIDSLALMAISNINDTGNSSNAFLNDSIVLNHGSLYLDNALYGLNNNGLLSNNSLIEIQDCQTTGLLNQDSLYNGHAGFIDVKIPEIAHATGIHNSSMAYSLNEGTINISRLSTPNLRNNSFRYKSATTDSLTGIFNQGILTNDSLIFIQSLDTGLSIDTTNNIEVFENRGILAILYSTNYSLVLKGHLVNNIAGEILIMSRDSEELNECIDIEIHSGATMDCFGQLDTEASYIPPWEER